MARSTCLIPIICFGILKTLVDEHFFEFDPASKFYRLGAAPARLFQVDTLLNEWTRWLKDELMSLANEFETCQGLWEIAADRATLLEFADSPLQTRIHLPTGQPIPAQIDRKSVEYGKSVSARDKIGGRRNI